MLWQKVSLLLACVCNMWSKTYSLDDDILGFPGHLDGSYRQAD